MSKRVSNKKSKPRKSTVYKHPTKLRGGSEPYFCRRGLSGLRNIRQAEARGMVHTLQDSEAGRKILQGLLAGIASMTGKAREAA